MILLFGYNSDLAFRTSKAGVREWAENLWHRLMAKRMVCCADRDVDSSIISLDHSSIGLGIMPSSIMTNLRTT